MNKLIFRFKVWRLMGGMMVPKWYQNLSIYWSQKEQKLQAGVARTHKQIGDILVDKTTGDIDWGDDVEELSIEGNMDSDTLFIYLKPRPMSWQEKAYQEDGIII